MLERPTLVLNRSWLPVHVTSVGRALCMVYRKVARVVCTETLATHDLREWIERQDALARAFIRTPSVRIPVPEVVVLVTYNRMPNHDAPFTRRNLFLRDEYTCQYCGTRCASDRLSIDHVLPRSRGGATSWDNCVLACVACNARKADQTLKEAGLRLLRAPSRPRWTPYLTLRPHQRLDSWHRFAADGNRRASHGS